MRAPASRHAIIAARDTAQLDEWCGPLILGHLVVCGNCDALKFGSDAAGLGHCARFDIEAAPFCPFQCPGFQIAEEPAALPFVPDPAGVRARAREFK